jgi:hypothetical protein
MNKECGKWMHDDCLRHDALMKIYERLGKTTPQIFDEAVVKKEGDEEMTTPAAPENKEDGTAEASDVPKPAKLPLFTPAAQSSTAPTPKKGARKEPYRGLFEASIRLDSGPTVWHVKDLRENVSGGVKEWLEAARCLFCDKLLD